ncbi:RNA-directed RNA polymerase L [Gossypium arboreum]|nr:RNA-directed RNA polymerase L [Gossypium arboreum]
MLPINYESWHQIPNSNKNQALYNIKDRFALEVLDNYVKKALGKKWKDHKSTLKKEYFKKNISLEEKLQNVPLGMLRYQWEDAVRFWNSKKGEDRERVGTTSRQNQKFTHTAGPKTFACVAEAEELSPGQKVGCLQLFDITHRKKDGSLMTSEAEEIMEKLKDKKAGYEAVASNDSSVNLEDIDNKVITEFLGPKSMREAEVERKYEELQLQLKAEAATREAKAVVREAEQSKKYNALQLQLRNMMKMF